jgi:hypothetical protein
MNTTQSIADIVDNIIMNYQPANPMIKSLNAQAIARVASFAGVLEIDKAGDEIRFLQSEDIAQQRQEIAQYMRELPAALRKVGKYADVYFPRDTLRAGRILITSEPHIRDFERFIQNAAEEVTNHTLDVDGQPRFMDLSDIADRANQLHRQTYKTRIRRDSAANQTIRIRD